MANGVWLAAADATWTFSGFRGRDLPNEPWNLCMQTANMFSSRMATCSTRSEAYASFHQRKAVAKMKEHCTPYAALAHHVQCMT